MTQTIIKPKISSGRGELSDLVRELATIVDVKLIQQRGNEYNQKYVDLLVRWGFKASETVYKASETVYGLTFEFKHSSTRKDHWLRLNPDLQLLMANYRGVESPEELIGKQVYCLVEKSIFHGSIQEIEPYNN